jgi:uncharacterized protein YciI
MKLKLNIIVVILLLGGVQTTFAQQKTEPEYKLVQFQMALFKRANVDQAKTDPNFTKIRDEHRAYIKSLLETGKAVIAGPFSETGEVIGVAIFKTDTAEEAKALVDADPMAKAGYFAIEMHPWWAAEVMKKPALPLKMTTAYFAFLARGPKWTAEKTPQTEELQKAHLANINRLAEMKKLVVAGPFGDNGELRGICVFKVASLEEAKTLAETDPAVQAGRLAIELRTWTVPEGILP